MNTAALMRSCHFVCLEVGPIVAVWMMSLVAALAGPIPLDTVNSQSVPEILHLTAERYLKITHLAVTYTMRDNIRRAGGGSSDVSLHVAAGSPGRSFVWNRHRYSDIPVEFDTNDHCCEVVGNTLQLMYNSPRYCEVVERVNDEAFALKATRPFAFESLGWMADVPAGPSEDFEIQYAKALSSGDYRQVAGSAEAFVVESDSNKDRIGFVKDGGNWQIQFREVLHGKPAIPFVRFDYDDFQMVGNDLRLPFRIRRRQFRYSTEASLHSHCVGDISIEIHSIETDPTEVGKHRIEMLPGTLVLDRRTGRIRQIPGGLQLLDTIVQRERDFVSVAISNPGIDVVNSFAHSSDLGEAVTQWFLIAAVVVAVIAYALIQIASIPRKVGSPQ